MKKIFSIGFLMVFMSMYIKPYIPYIDYFFNKEYIAEELCENKDKPELKCDGKCHLKKEIEKVITEEKEDPVSSHPLSKKQKKQKQINLFINGEEEIIHLSIYKKDFFFYQDLISTYLEIPGVPPPQSFS